MDIHILACEAMLGSSIISYKEWKQIDPLVNRSFILMLFHLLLFLFTNDNNHK